MAIRNPFIAVLLSSVLVAGTVTGQGTVEQGEHHTQVAILADVKSVRPGSTFTVGILMKMEKGWHTYWENSGEAGLPTTIQWTVPRGITTGEILWPLPRKYNESGEILTYGYEGENMLLVPVRVAPEIRPGSSVTLRAKIDWLECERLCVPGSATATLTLPVSSDPPVQADEPLFRKYRAQVPEALGSDKDIIVTMATVPGAVEVSLTSQSANLIVRQDITPDFYPHAIDEIAFGRTQVTVKGRRAVLRIPLSVYEKVDTALNFSGVLLFQLESGEPRMGVVGVPLSAAFVSSLPIAGEETPSGSLLDWTFVGEGGDGEPLPLSLYLLFALIGGLLLNIMPCVLPVIALKVFGLVKMSGDQPAQVKRHGLSFSVGILGSFLVLALLVVLLQAGGEQVGWGFQFQEPLFIITMSAIVFAFGLSLFGVFEVGLLFMLAFASVGSALEKKARSGKGYTASFSEGVFATILATPCTAPFLGTALGFAFVQPPEITLLMFATVGLGMALPYLVLTARPAWTRFLPKPGEWMVTAKQFMGFLMMGTVIWLLYVLGRQLGVEAVIWTSAFLLVVAVACWIVGRYATLNAPRPRYLGVWAVALALVAAGYVFFMEVVLDVRNVIAGTASATTAQVRPDKDGISWQPFSLATLELYLNDSRTVFIDFTADWCLTCKVNERTVLTDRTVVEKFQSGNVVAIKADWTNRNPDITRLLAKFGRSGVPLYVVFPAGRPNAPIILPEVITSGIVLDAIERATSTASVSLVP